MQTNPGLTCCFKNLVRNIIPLVINKYNNFRRKNKHISTRCFCLLTFHLLWIIKKLVVCHFKIFAVFIQILQVELLRGFGVGVLPQRDRVCFATDVNALTSLGPVMTRVVDYHWKWESALFQLRGLG